MRLVKAAEMQELDRLTIRKLGISGIVLMENAGRGASRLFLNHFDPLPGSHVLVLCGSGNNGGDGYVMARYLFQAGLKVKLEDCDYIIDGILGTGLSTPVRGLYSQVIEEVNSLEKPVLAVDIPSGINADTGQIMGTAIEADITVTFGFPKVGELISPGAELAGRLTRIDISIPDTVADQVPAEFHMIEPNHFKDFFHMERQDIHKGDRGHVLVIAGSIGKTGAAVLTATGALRAGAGLVTLGVPESLNPVFEEKLTEAMTVPLPETS
ncbi:MAG: bifunctional ADP-dependent NAD(P)H-hydrate dehydratase/NAD(P)H-hydrate epimerase, partial [Deltaproteobacteria bacterium]|nr:bifunctional ADP-dependent NAD(P)H-hydrate dehydratase/NAD(P)H-hydrate epimerase [Deltaproteobacteria bacterium]